MESFRIVNFVLQLSYLAAHMVFQVHLLRIRRATPIWTWFLIFSVALWLWVSGRFAESIVYLFLPTNNSAYVFAASYQYLGLTASASAYCVWNLYLCGHDRLGDSRLLRGALLLYPITVCTLVFTNESHHLVYTRLVMGERVAHGAAFAPVAYSGYLLLLSAYVAVVVHILRSGEQVPRRLFLFSVFPVLLAANTGVRTVSGVDRYDFTPVVMGLSIASLSLIVFKYNDMGIVPASINAIVDQALHPIGIYSRPRGEYLYQNRIARERYAGEMASIAGTLPRAGEFEHGFLSGNAVPLSGEETTLVVVTDTGELSRQLQELRTTVARLREVSAALEEENRNIDAYLEMLYHTEGLREKQEQVDRVYRQINAALEELRRQLIAAREDPEEAQIPLEAGICTAEECMGTIRAAVARLREG